MADAGAVANIRAEALSIANASLLAAERHYASEGPWYYTLYWIGLPTACLSALAGAAAFSDPSNSKIAGFISLLVTILTAIMTFLDPSSKAGTHHTTAKAYEALYHTAGVFYRVESQKTELEPAKAEEVLKELVDRFNEINKSSPAVPGFALKRAGKLITEGKGEVVRDYSTQNPQASSENPRFR